MRVQLVAGLLLLVVGGLLFWNDLRERQQSPTPIAGRVPAVPLAPPSPSPGPLFVVEPEITTAEETPAVAPETPVPSESTRSPGHPVTRVTSPEVVPGPEVAPGLSPKIVLENLRSAFRNYQARLGGNPVGTNLEITRALNGANAGQAIFLNAQEDGLRVNERGELVDNWGTPYFFHQVSGKQMEIRSAGADRRMWTADDLVLR
jgi:hypothetical protein